MTGAGESSAFEDRVQARAGRVPDKVVLVSGAARGIGAATARWLAAEGARLYLNDIDPLVQELAGENIRAASTRPL